MATTKELEERVSALQNQLTDMEGAIRRMAQENNSLVSMVAKISDDLNASKADVATLKRSAEARARAEAKAGVTKY